MSQIDVTPKSNVTGPLSGGSTDNAIARWDGVTGTLLQNSGSTLSDANLLSTGELNLSTALAVAYGGTGLSATTAYAVLCGGTTSGSSLQSVSGVGTASQVLTSNGPGALPTWEDATGGGGTISGPGSSTDNALVRWNGTDGTVIQNSGATLSDAGVLTLSTALAVDSGGSGRSSATAYAVICGGTTSTGAHQSVSGVGSNGQVLTSGGAGVLPTWTSIAGGGDVTAAANLGDNLLIRGDGAGKGVQNSGITISDTDAITGAASLDVSGDYQIGATSVLNATTLGSGVTASSLTSVGTITSGTWSATDVAVDAGGSGRSSATAYAVICGGTTGTGAHQSIAGLGTSGQLLTSGGAGALPSFTSPAPESLTTALTAGSVVFSDGSNLAQDNSNFFWDDTNNRLGLGTTTPLDTLHVVGNMDLVHTASENDDHALEIDCDAAGFGDVKALDIVYTTGAVAAAEDEEAILINIDETLSTGGEVVAVQVLSTTEGSAAIVASKCGPGVDAIRQETGTFGNMDSALNKAVDVLAALSSGGAGNISLFVADNDTFTIGDAATFGAMEIIVDTGASGAGIAPTFEYSTGVGTWAAFSPADGTNGFRNTGVIEWNVSDLAGFAVGTGSEYLIRITRTRNTLATTPIVDEVQIAALTEFKWDLNGDVNLNSLTLATDLAVDEGGSGRSSATAYAVICGGTTGTGAHQSIAGVGTSGQVLTSNGAGALPTFQAGGGGSMPDVNVGGLAASHQVNTTTAFPPVSYRDFGSIEMLVRSFDDTGPEYMQNSFRVPTDLGSGASNVTFEIVGSAATAASSKNVKFTFDFVEVADDGLLTGAYGSAEVWDDQSISATQDDQDIISNTETITNLGWTAGNQIYYRLYRAAATTNNLSGDYDVIAFNILIPRA